jgi:hypothetical protein
LKGSRELVFGRPFLFDQTRFQSRIKVSPLARFVCRFKVELSGTYEKTRDHFHP